jgi:uracil-DNA glycosylase family 4
MKEKSFTQLIQQVRQCNACEGCLPLGPRPIIQVHGNAKLLIIGQAPGLKAHQTGIPWNDASGERLREWLGLSNEIFYDKNKVALLPMGFCYPGKGERGDLPPQKECFNLWHEKVITNLPKIKLVLLLGSYAQNTYLKNTRKKSLTETVRAWEEYLPRYIPFPHPSPLNNIWLHKNNWFIESMLPSARRIIKSVLR